MGKSKKHKKVKSSESEDSSESSSSSASSSTDDTTSEASSSSDNEKRHKKRKMTKSKTKSKRERKKSSSSSSSSNSSSESDNDDHSKSSSSSNTSAGKKSKTKKSHKKHGDKKDPIKVKRLRSNGNDERIKREESSENARKESSDLHNRSKWDSPGNEADDNRRVGERPRERNWNRDRDYSDSNYKRYRRNEDNRGGWFSNRRNNYNMDRRRNRGREYENERNRDHDQKYRARDDNYNGKRYNNWDNRNRRDYRDNRNQRDRDNRDSRNQKDDRDNRNQRDNREDRRSRSPRRPRNFPRRRSNDGDDKNYEWGKKDEDEKPERSPEEKEKPNFGLSGKLTEEANKVNGIVIKYAEPPESRKPKRRWRLYPFKGEKALPTLYIHRQSCYLIGRDRKVCDLPVDHPSCSKQHAAFQYRLVPFERDDRTVGKRVRPYLIDLESANGTFINNKKIESKKYIELLEKDVVKFGFSSREYVLLHENSKEDQLDDDITEDIEVKTEPADD